MEQTNHTAEEIAKKAFDSGRLHLVTDMTNDEIKEHIASEIKSYHTQRLQELKDPTKIEEVLESEMEHRKIHDEFGFTGQYSLSNKQVLDVLITLLQNHIDDE